MKKNKNVLLEFKMELFNEDKSYLGKRIGDVLNGIQDLEQNFNNMGSRESVDNAERIVNQIRRIIHTNWPRDDRKHLEPLQKIGVAIMRAIEEKGDLLDIVSNSGKELQSVLGDLGVTVNNLGSPDSTQSNDGTGTAKSQVETDPQPEENQDPAPAQLPQPNDQAQF